MEKKGNTMTTNTSKYMMIIIIKCKNIMVINLNKTCRINKQTKSLTARSSPNNNNNSSVLVFDYISNIITMST